MACEFLILNSVRIDAVDAHGNSALHMAAKQGNTGQVSFHASLFLLFGFQVCLLLKHHADHHLKNIEGQEPLDIAVANSDADIVTLLRLLLKLIPVWRCVAASRVTFLILLGSDIVWSRLAALNEEIREADMTLHDDTFNDVVQVRINDGVQLCILITKMYRSSVGWCILIRRGCRRNNSFFLSFLPRKRTLFPRSCIHTKKRQYGKLPIQYAEALMWQFNQIMILHCDYTNQLLQFQRHNSPDKILETIPDMPIERDSDVLPDVFCWSFKAFIMKLPLVLLPSPDMLLVQSKIYDTCDKKTWPAFEVRLN